MTTPLGHSRRISRELAPSSATRRTPSQTRIPARNSSQTGIPMANSRSAANRQANIQPSYDLIGEAERSGSTPPKAQRSLRTAISKADLGNEDLRAQLKTLQYELETFKQDAELTRVRHEKELRDAQAKAEADYKRAQASDKSSTVSTQKYAALSQKLKESQDAAANKQHDLERRLRQAQDESRSNSDEAESLRSELATQSRQHAHEKQESDAKVTSADRSASDARAAAAAAEAEVTRLAGLLATKSTEAGELETALLQLRAQAGDAEELTTIRRELADQVGHLRQVERTNREQATELRRLREERRAVGVVEEERRALELKLERMSEVERELGEEKYHRQRLENERATWASFLESDEAGGEDGDVGEKFDSPAAVARALATERSERASLAERLGAAHAEFAEKEALIQGLEAEKKDLKAKIEKLKSTGGSTTSTTDRVRARSERQKALAVKEAEYLRAQLRTFEQEDATLELDIDKPSVDEELRSRVTQLEDLVAQYRSELDTAASELSEKQQQRPAPAPDAKSLKRSRDQDGEEDEAANAQLGVLSRKNRKLADELSSATQRATLLASELDASKARVVSLQEAAGTRVLSLRNNPTDDFERAKLSAIKTLRTENEGLHALLERRGPADVVPRASLAAKETELEEERLKVGEREKRMLRLKQTWAAKSNELRGAVASILGWNLVPTANGKFKLASIFNPGDEDEDDEAGIGSNHLVFDAEKGEMLVNGGPNGEFGRDIKSLIKFWVEGRKEIPGLMAACTLEFYERTTRAQPL